MTDNPEQSLKDFFDKIESWVNSAPFLKTKISPEVIDEILDVDTEKLKQATTEELLVNVHKVYAYIDHLQEICNKEKAIFEFCEESIWRIISPVFSDYGDNWTKWEIKYNLAVKENPLAQKINVLRINSKARLTMVEHRIENIKRRADLIFEIARRRKYDNFNRDS